jgi:hypothetical protein
MIDGMWTIHGLAKELGVDKGWLYHRIYTGVLQASDVIRVLPYGNYLIRDDSAVIAQLRAEAQALQQQRAKSHS